MGRITSIESIDHGSFLKETSMDYGTIEYGATVDDDSSRSQLKQRAIAEKLLSKLHEPNSWKFYLKCAYHLSEDQIWSAVELATKPQVKYPNRYFVCLAKKMLEK